MLFLVSDFVVNININIEKLYVALLFTFLYLKQDCGSKYVTFLVGLFHKKLEENQHASLEKHDEKMQCFY